MDGSEPADFIGSGLALFIHLKQHHFRLDGSEMGKIFNGMPVIVPESHMRAWLDTVGTEESLELAHGPLMAHTQSLDPAISPVNREMSNSKNEGAEAAAPIPWDPSNELEPRGRVIDALQSVFESSGPASIEDLQGATGYDREQIQLLLIELATDEQVVPVRSPGEVLPRWAFDGTVPRRNDR